MANGMCIVHLNSYLKALMNTGTLYLFLAFSAGVGADNRTDLSTKRMVVGPIRYTSLKITAQLATKRISKLYES